MLAFCHHFVSQCAQFKIIAVTFYVTPQHMSFHLLASSFPLSRIRTHISLFPFLALQVSETLEYPYIKNLRAKQSLHTSPNGYMGG